MELEHAWRELGVSEGASEAEVKRAWRRLAATWHPDRNPTAEAALRMQRLNQAMARVRAWREGEGEDEGEAAEEAPPQPPAQESPAAEPSSPPGRHRVARAVELDLEAAALGTETLLEGEVADPCVPCGGTGEVAPPLKCTVCDGQGTVRQMGWLPWLAAEAPCSTCEGTGSIRQTCGACEGDGTLPVRGWSVRVRLPAGVRDGMTLEIPEGRAGGSHAGVALVLSVHLRPHPVFTLESTSPDGPAVLRCTMPVDALDWLAAATVQVPVPGGWQAVTLAPPQVYMRVPGHGFPERPRGPRGDLELRLEPQFPVSLDADEQRRLRKLAASTKARAEAVPGHPLARWRQALEARNAPGGDRPPSGASGNI